jgi:hypothetical protein
MAGYIGKTPVPQPAQTWVTYTPSSATVLDSTNVTSLTDNGTGDTSVSYTSAMSSRNYAQMCSAAKSSDVSPFNLTSRIRSTNYKLAGSTRVNVGYSSTTQPFTLFDYPYSATAIHGDLA